MSEVNDATDAELLAELERRQSLAEEMDLEQAQIVLAHFESDMKRGHPYIPGLAFNNNPGLDKYVLIALKAWVSHKGGSSKTTYTEAVDIANGR